MPYHNLGEAHRRLMEQLPEEAGYRDVVVPTIGASLRSVLKKAAANSRADHTKEAVHDSGKSITEAEVGDQITANDAADAMTSNAQTADHEQASFTSSTS